MELLKNVVEIQEQADPYAHVEALKLYLKANKITQAEVARRIEYSNTAISQYLGRKYDKGDLYKLDGIVASFLEAERQTIEYTPNIRGVALTSQVKNCNYVIEYVVRHRSFGAIVGEAGTGKSEALKEFARTHRNNSLLITMDPLKRSPVAFIQHLWCNLPGFSRGKRWNLPKAAFLFDDIVEYFKNKHKTVLIDEAQFLSMSALETARSIQDQTGIGFVLAGTFELDQDLGFGGYSIPDNAQLYSRVKIHRSIKATITKKDLAAVCELYGIAEVSIVAWLHKRCNRIGRRYRWVNAILSVAYDLSVKHQVPFSVEVLEMAVKTAEL